MGIHVACPNGHQLNVKSYLAGKRGICPRCDARFDIPPANPGWQAGQSVAASTASNGSVVLNVERQTAAREPATTQQSLVQAGSEATLAVALQPHEPASREGSPPASSPPASLPIVWYVRPVQGGQYGPATDDILQQWIAEGRIGDDSYIWRTGWPDWQTVGQARHLLPAAGSPVDRASPDDSPGDVAEAAPTTFDSAIYVQRKRRARRFQLVFAGILFALVLVLAAVLVWVLTHPAGVTSADAARGPHAPPDINHQAASIDSGSDSVIL